ncbi:caspase family protein [Crossiella sp. CA-258035]|uniref:caspase family protein n=1 Tax=Crossiella sp. CA-258035 TaxID=2981138 RepID=UPI0024BC5CE6|nr:caspase family protein [Crossiella sp. CA-258035]WHT17556.1 caspase family protein [Crossiella sp. CA-258035]
MGTVHALLVGVNDYAGRVRPLRGTHHDVGHAEEYLRTRVERPKIRVLLDADATRQAVVTGLREHLGRARRGDTALFWFSGHGSEAPVAAGFEATAPNGRTQTIVCADSRLDGGEDLLDRELGALLDAVSTSGAHVVAVLDCCHSDGSTRGDTALIARGTPARLLPPRPESLVPELFAGTRDVVGRRPSHVLLAACDIREKAYEKPFRGFHRGVFSRALLGQLAALGPGVGYRELLVAVSCDVENVVSDQHPTLQPVIDPLADQPFLGGAVRSTSTGTRARYVRGWWQVDAGACHGMPEPVPGDPVEFGVVGSDPVRLFRTVDVVGDHSKVEPVGWTPDRAQQHPVVTTRVPLPGTSVALDPSGEDPAAAERIAAALRVATPGGGPSPHVRPVDPGQVADIRVVVRGPGVVDVTSADGDPFFTRVDVRTADAAARVVADMEHVARWRAVKGLVNPNSALAHAVRVEVLSERGGPMPLDKSGVLRASYRGTAPPKVLVRLRNTHHCDLFCVLLDLTDQYRVHPGLFPGGWVRARYSAYAAGGRAITLSLPPGRPVEPGASVRDWFKLLVSEERFSADPFRLPRLGEKEPAAVRGTALGGIVDRLGLAATQRTTSDELRGACDWMTSIASVMTMVP